MAYKIVISNRCSSKLVTTFAYLEKNFPTDHSKKLVDKIDGIMLLLSHQHALGVPSSKLAKVYKISISRKSKLYYRVKGRKIIILDLLDTNIDFEQ